MSEDLNDRIRRTHDLFRRDHDGLREQLMAALPQTGPEPIPIGRLRRGWQWIGATKMRKSIFSTGAVAASLILAALLWTPDNGGRQAYGMNDVVNALRSGDVLHAQGYMFQPPFAPPGEERTRCPIEIWVDLRNGRERQISSWARVDEKGTHVFLTERVSDGEFVMDVNHTEETVEYTRLNPFRRTLETYRSFDRMIEEWFGRTENPDFVNSERVKLGGKDFDLWRAELSEPGQTNMRVECWISPHTREVGALKYWMRHPSRPEEWTLVRDVHTIERDVPIPPGTFDTIAPQDYSLINTKETAIVPELDMGGGMGLDGVWIKKHVEFTLEDGSILVGWSSFDDRTDEPQDELFSDLTFGGAVPKLPLEMYALRPSQPNTDVTLVGVHLAHTSKKGRFYEWSLYVPNWPSTARRPAAGYEVLHRINSERKISATSRTSVQALVRVRNMQEFDALVLGAMVELSDEAQPPQGVTYERVMELSRQKQDEAVAASRPANSG